MIEDFASKLARVMTDYSTAVQPGDVVVIMGGVHTEPLVEALFEAVMRRGGNPIVQTGFPGTQELFFRLASDDQLSFVNPITRWIIEKADVFLQIESPTNTRSLTNIPPVKMSKLQQAHAELVPIQLQRISDRSLRWCLMPWPSFAAAQQTEMGIHEYTEFLYRACGFTEPDPVAYWRGVKAEQERLVDYLSDKSHAEVKGPGIDLSFDFDGRAWISAHAEVNFPDGEIFTGPIEDSVNGTVAFNMRSVLYGREVQGVRFTYVDGVIVDATAEKGEEFLLNQLDLDVGARRMGEFAIGTNWNVDRVTGSTLLDEKIGGTIHMAVGASIPMTRGVNQSKLHWDMVHDMKNGGEITIDGKLFYQNGKFVV